MDNKQVKTGGVDAEPTTVFKIKTKNSSVNLKDVHSNLVGYISTLPEELQNEVLVTSGNDSDAHSKNSWHYHNRAMDLRFSKKLYDYMVDDPNRIKYQISLYNPNHGTGKHIHISHIGEEGVKNGAREHLSDVFMNVYSPEAQAYLADMQNEKYKPLREKALSYGSMNYNGDKGANSIAGAEGLYQNVAYTPLQVEDHDHDHYHSYSYADVNYRMDMYGGSGNSDMQDLISQNQLLLSKMMEIESDKKKEAEYNAQQAVENEHKERLAQKQKEYDFIKQMIINLPSGVRDAASQPSQPVSYDPNMFRITNFQNNMRVAPIV